MATTVRWRARAAGAGGSAENASMIYAVDLVLLQ